MFKFNHVGEYKDRFLQFDQNNGIRIYFTVGKHGMAKDVNHSLLEKVRHLLFNSSLDKSFWAEMLVYANHLMNCLSLIAIREKLHWIFGQAELLKTMLSYRYLNV